MSLINILSNRKEAGRIGNLELDATISESHEFVNEVTDFPIEDGSNISDHIKRQPASITIEGFITDSPVQFIAELLRSVFSRSSSRVAAAYEELMKIAGREYPDQPSSITVAPNEPQIVEIVTSLRTYSNMALVRLSIRANASTGEALQFIAQFKQLRKVSSELIKIAKTQVNDGGSGSATDGASDQASSDVDSGKQNAKPLKSTAVKIVDFLKDKFTGGN